MDEFVTLFLRICIVETKVTEAAKVLRDIEVQTDRLRVADLEVAIGFRRETRLHTPVMLTGRHIGSHYLADEISWGFFIAVGHKRSDKRSATICASQKIEFGSQEFPKVVQIESVWVEGPASKSSKFAPLLFLLVSICQPIRVALTRAHGRQKCEGLFRIEWSGG